MGVYSPEQLGISAPAGGFQTGGWYSGRQYWDGTLSEPGQIHPSSNQPGAGGVVSEEVIGQTDPENVGYIQEEREEAGLAPAPATGVPQPSYQPTPTTPSTPGTGFDGGSITDVFSAEPSINLPEIYKELYAGSGIEEKEGTLVEKEKQYLEARGKISDNPFLSASMVDQRLQRLERKYKKETDPLRSEIAMKKADIETQINLQSRQFDINSTQAQNSLAYFNTLLDLGALDTASGEAIASITKSTGLPSSFIQSAINAKKEKDKDLYIDTFTADSGEVTAIIIDKNTGNVVTKTSLGNIGNQQGGGGVSASEAKQLIRNDIINEASVGATWDSIYQLAVAGGLSKEDAYSIYVSFGIYNPDTDQQEEDLAKYP